MSGGYPSISDELLITLFKKRKIQKCLADDCLLRKRSNLQLITWMCQLPSIAATTLLMDGTSPLARGAAVVILGETWSKNDAAAIQSIRVLCAEEHSQHC